MELSIKNIKVSLSNIDIVKDVSLHVKKGRFVGIIGPNGCGKSTLLKSVYKVNKPKGGSIYLNEIDLINTMPKVVSKSLGVVGQFNEMSFDFSVKEMVLMGRTPHKGLLEPDNAEDYKIVNKALEQVNLIDYADRSYISLSGGEKQRVILARAIAQEPKFLILDEPTNHLDIKYQLQILRVVKELKVGVLAALHDLSLTCDYCDYVYVMKKGKIVTHGDPHDLLTKELIQEVYEVNCETYTNPITGKLGIAYM
ncbi:MAG: ABC transporter ATP-binding protein [Lachnospirales bacterium]